MVTWQGNAPRSRPHRQRGSSMSACPAAREPGCDSSEALQETDAGVEQAEAALVPGVPRSQRGAADRLPADQLVVEAVLEEGLHGPRHRELEEVLIRYAVPVLRQLLAEGQIVSKAARLGRPPGNSEAWLDFTRADREEFAYNMVADALPVFTKAVFVERRWSPDRGASLKTYFVNACILQFPRLYREWLDQRRTVRPVGLELDPGGADPAPDPAIMAGLRDETAHVLEKIPDRQIQEVLVLRGAGYTAEDAARQAGLTPKAAENRLARIRKGPEGRTGRTRTARQQASRHHAGRTAGMTPKRLGEPDVGTAHQESRGINVDQHFKDLIEASSLGTPAARQIRSSTPPAVVEDVRRRRTEHNALQASSCQAADHLQPVDAATGEGAATGRYDAAPVHRSIVVLDIESSAQRTNPVKEELRRQVYRLVGEALAAAGIDDHQYDPFTDRGDGVLVLVSPADDSPKQALMGGLIQALTTLAAEDNTEYNSGTAPAGQPRGVVRLRAVVHTGEVHFDDSGVSGEALDVAFRLLEAPAFKAYVRRRTAPLTLVASDEIYQSVIRHGFDGDEFCPLVTVNVGDRRRKGWVYLPRPGGFPEDQGGGSRSAHPPRGDIRRSATIREPAEKGPDLRTRVCGAAAQRPGTRSRTGLFSSRLAEAPSRPLAPAACGPPSGSSSRGADGFQPADVAGPRGTARAGHRSSPRRPGPRRADC